VELALIVTLMVMLLGAAVDLGNAYRAYQMLVNASAEASTYLTHRPIANCVTQSCPGNDPIQGANREARLRFREEQSAGLGSAVNLRDLDSTGVDDLQEHGWSWIDARIRIVEADDSQVSTNHRAIGRDFSGTSNADCRARQRLDGNNRYCYIVVLAEFEYRPFVIRWLIGDTITVRAVSIRQIVEGV
jgi:hypothetical protein